MEAGMVSTPLWVLAEKQGMRSACFFWPGSEAEIDGERPSHYLNFDDHFPDEPRIDQVIAWLRLPAAERPHFITLYYSNVDHAGHVHGPDCPESAAAVAHVDQLMGDLYGRSSANWACRLILLVMADHGMEHEQGPWIDLDKYADLEQLHHGWAFALSQFGRRGGGKGVSGTEDQERRFHRLPS